jgi:hypothetical protein
MAADGRGQTQPHQPRRSGRGWRSPRLRLAMELAGLEPATSWVRLVGSRPRTWREVGIVQALWSVRRPQHESDPVGYRWIPGDPGTPGYECPGPARGLTAPGGESWARDRRCKTSGRARRRPSGACMLRWRQLLAERTQCLGQHPLGSLDVGVELGSALASLCDLIDARTVGEFVGFPKLGAQLL